VDHCLVGAITKILIEIRVLVKTHGDPVQLFDICLFSVPADPNCEARRKKEMETKYTGEWLEKLRTKPICFVSRNQKRPGRHFYCFLETKHAHNPALFPMFPFSCVSTSTLTSMLPRSLGYVCLSSFLVRCALYFISTCWPSNSGPELELERIQTQITSIATRACAPDLISFVGLV